MIADLDAWLADLTARPAETIDRPVRVSGERDQHLGPRWERAGVEVIVEPSARWEVKIELPDEVTAPDVFLRQAVLGMLDVLTTRPARPLLNVRVRVVGAMFDPIESSERAFRLAGRDAAEKLLTAVAQPAAR